MKNYRNNYYVGLKDRPFHLSVGAVLINNKEEVAVNHFRDTDNLGSFYVLMRETIEMGETLEQALHRGLMEEFGAKGKILTFLGSLASHFQRGNKKIEKTTLYFLVELSRIDQRLRNPEGLESKAQVEWVNIDKMINEMKKQKYPDRSDSDESKILIRAKGYFNENFNFKS